MERSSRSGVLWGRYDALDLVPTLTPDEGMRTSLEWATPIGLALTMLFPPALRAQLTPPELPIDPDLPVKEGFDVERAYIGAQPLFTPLRNPEYVPLRSALRKGDVRESTPMLVFEVGSETLSLVTAQMAYHHVAQGDIAGEPWMVTF